MLINKEKDIYLVDGRLDLSLLNENEGGGQLVTKGTQIQEEYSSILEDIESLELKDEDISTTLQEMAMIFEQEDEYKKAFNKERLEKEMKEFE